LRYGHEDGEEGLYTVEVEYNKLSGEFFEDRCRVLESNRYTEPLGGLIYYMLLLLVKWNQIWIQLYDTSLITVIICIYIFIKIYVWFFIMAIRIVSIILINLAYLYLLVICVSFVIIVFMAWTNEPIGDSDNKR